MPINSCARLRAPHLGRLATFLGIFFGGEGLERGLLDAYFEVGWDDLGFFFFLFAQLFFFFLFLLELVAQHALAGVRADAALRRGRRAEGGAIAHCRRAMRLADDGV